MKEIKEEIFLVIPVMVHYKNAEARAAAMKTIVKLHLDCCSSEGYRARIERKGWELDSTTKKEI